MNALSPHPLTYNTTTETMKRIERILEKNLGPVHAQTPASLQAIGLTREDVLRMTAAMRPPPQKSNGKWVSPTLDKRVARHHVKSSRVIAKKGYINCVQFSFTRLGLDYLESVNDARIWNRLSFTEGDNYIAICAASKSETNTSRIARYERRTYCQCAAIRHFTVIDRISRWVFAPGKTTTEILRMIPHEPTE